MAYRLRMYFTSANVQLAQSANMALANGDCHDPRNAARGAHARLGQQTVFVTPSFDAVFLTAR